MASICLESTLKSTLEMMNDGTAILRDSQNILTVWWRGHSRWFKEASVDFKYDVVV